MATGEEREALELRKIEAETRKIETEALAIDAQMRMRDEIGKFFAAMSQFLRPLNAIMTAELKNRMGQQ